MIFLILLISSLGANSVLDGGGNVDATIHANFEDSIGKEVYFNVSGFLNDLEVRDKSGLVIPHRIIEKEGHTLIFVTVPFDYLQLNFNSPTFTAKNGSTWDYSFSLSSSQNISEFSASLSMPEGTIIRSTNGAVISNLIEWHVKEISNKEKAILRASFELREVQQDLLLPLGIFIGFILAIYFLTKTKKTEPPFLKGLDKIDKEIILEILRNKGKTTQAHLFLHTNIPKVTLSRRLASLENRGIIIKTQKGTRNLITLNQN